MEIQGNPALARSRGVTLDIEQECRPNLAKPQGSSFLTDRLFDVLRAYFSRRLSDPKGPLEGPRTMCTWPAEIGS
jgi:hypothetical protein